MAWRSPTELPDLRRASVIALDIETSDDRLATDMGSGWPFKAGHICGVSIAYREDNTIRALYFPLRHPDSTNFDPTQVFQWLRDLIASDVRIVGQNTLYDFGWLRVEADVGMPPSERLEEIGALAALVDENRYSYSLDELCKWRGLPGKDETLLHQGIEALGLVTNKRKKIVPQNYVWQLPAHYVGTYAEGDAANTLALFESLDPILSREGTRNAYRLEVDLLPMVLEMRRRGIRVDTGAAERARNHLLQKRDKAFAELSEKLGASVSMAEIGRTKWLAEIFDKHGIKYPRTAKGNPSFTAGASGWMHKHPHWLPQLIVEGDRYNKAAVDFLEKHILAHAVKGRIHAEIHPHRSDDGGTRSLRFSYSNPPLQQMAARDEEIAPLIRGVFLPEEGEVWAKPDISQQEFRFIVHYAAKLKLQRAQEAAERYRADAHTDFHDLVAEMTGLARKDAKAVNFAKAFGAGVSKFATMIGRPESEARAIYERYDRTLPFVRALATRCTHLAATRGHIELYDGARRHWPDWVPPVDWTAGAGPCSREEAERRISDPSHPWHGKGPLRRANTHKAMNALIQGSAARHTKLWMRACWREGVVPLLQMHDCLDLSVKSPEQAERVAQLGRDAVKLEVPIQVDLKYGRTWGDATHTWEERHTGTRLHSTIEPLVASEILLGAAADFDQEGPGAINPDDGDLEIRDRNPGNAWTAPGLIELAPDSAVFEAILASLSPQDRAVVRPPETARGNGHDRDGARDGHVRYAGNGDGYPHGERNSGHKIAFYVYRHADGQPYLGVKRTSTKQFPQYHWTGDGWAKAAPEGPKIPYRLPELIKASLDAWVLICAGEKDADTAAGLGFVATTNPEGERKGAWTPELNTWFAGRKRVAVMEDNDATGRAHVIEVAEALRKIVPDIRVVTFRDIAEHGDLTDWKERGHGRDDLLAKIEATKPYRPRPQPSPIRQWDAELVPELEYSVPDRFPLDNVGLLSGEGGQGKSSLVEQLCVAHALGREWLGCTPRQGPAIYIECEDTERVLHWRLKAVAAHYGTTLTEIADAGFQMFPLADEENAVLATAPDKSGIIRPTPLYDWLYEIAGDTKPVMLCIASSANVFAGNENVRTEVQQFIRLLRRIAAVAHGTVLLVTQPSLTGIENKSASHEGLAGTTQWHNGVRARAVMKAVKSEDGIDTGLRAITFHKNQYGPASATCFVRYEGGLFLPVQGMSIDAAERAAKADELFVILLKKVTAQHQTVTHRASRSYAPTVFAEQPEAQGISKKEFARAMQRLLDAKVIEIRSGGRPSRPSFYLALAGEA